MTLYRDFTLHNVVESPTFKSKAMEMNFCLPKSSNGLIERSFIVEVRIPFHFFGKTFSMEVKLGTTLGGSLNTRFV